MREGRGTENQAVLRLRCHTAAGYHMGKGGEPGNRPVV